MANFQQTLQSQPSPAAPVQAPSATSAVAGVLEGALDMFSQYNQQQVAVKQGEAKALFENTAADYANELASGWSDRSGQPLKAKEWLRQQASSLGAELDPSLRQEVGERFFKLTGERLFSGQTDAMKDQNEADKVRLEVQQRQATDIQYAFDYRGLDAELSNMFNADGSLKEGVTAEQVAAKGRTVRVQQEARLAVLQNQSASAKSQSEKLVAEQKIREAELLPALTRDMNNELERLSGLPAVQAVQELDALYAAASNQLQYTNITGEGKNRIKASLDIVYNNLRDQLSGRRDQQAIAEINSVESLELFNMLYKASPTTRIVVAMKDNAISPTESMVQSAASDATKIMRDMEQGGPNRSRQLTGDETPDEVAMMEQQYRKIMSDNWVYYSTPDKPVETPEQVNAMTNHLSIGMNPVNAEQRRNFFGRDGAYIKSLTEWSSNPNYLKNIGASVLNNPDIKGAFTQNNQRALASYLQGVMDQTVDGSIFGEDVKASDILTVDNSGPYPRLGIRRPSGADGGNNRPVSGEQAQYNRAQNAVNNLNMLFKLQYESAVNYGDVVGDEEMARETVNAQMRALANYIKVDGTLQALKAD